VWWEFVKQDEYPQNNKSGYFRNQKKLEGLKVLKDIDKALEGIDVLVFAVRHKPYFDLNPEMVLEKAGKPIAVVDCFGILDDDKIRRYLQLGCEVKGLGRGHIRRLKEQVKKAEG